MTLATLMIGTTFVLGVVLVLLGCLAFFRGMKGGGGGLKIAGIEVSGKSGPSLILVIGAAFVVSGFGWASTHKDAQEARSTATVAVAQAQTFRGVAERTQAELVKADAALDEADRERAALRDSLKATVTPEKLGEIERTTPWLKAGRTWKPPAELMRPIGSVRGGGG